MGARLRVLSENYPLNTNMTGFRWSSKICVRVLWTKVASALEGLSSNGLTSQLPTVTSLNPYAAGGQVDQYIIMQKSWKITETVAYGYSFESTRWGLSNEYQYDRV